MNSTNLLHTSIDLQKVESSHAPTRQKLGSYTTPQQNKTCNLRSLISEE